MRRIVSSSRASNVVRHGKIDVDTSAERTGNMPSLAQRLKTSSEPEALWKGPEDSTRLGGITQGMINHFLSCRERFRVQFVEG
jgi:hypothetical protein